MTRRRWPKGTWMRLRNPDLLRAFLGDKKDGKKMSQRELADFVDCHPSMINHLTSGRAASCTPELAERIAKVLGVPLDVLFEARKASASSTRTARQKVPA